MKLLTQMRTAEAEYTRYVVTPQPDEPKSAVLTNAYWAHVASMLRPGDVVEVRPQDAAYFMELWLVKREYVHDGESRLTWRVVRDIDFGAPAKVASNKPDPSNVYAQWNPGRKYFEVRRRDDGANNTVLADGLTKEEAAEWIANYRAEAA